MTQERTQYPPQAVDSERLQVLQHLRSKIDPFQEGPEGERLRAIGLKKLYLQMADPSIELFGVVTGSLTSMPFSSLRQLRIDTYNAGENPRGFFDKHGIAIEDPERLQTGIGHSLELIENLVDRYDYQTDELRWGEVLDPKALAESAYEGIQIRNGKIQIERLVEAVRSEPNLARRYRRGLRLKKQILDYLNGFPFTLHRMNDRHERVEPTWKNLQAHHRLSMELKRRDGSIRSQIFELGEAVDVAQAAILRYPFEKRLEKLPSRDRDKFSQLRLKYGAKAANLIILSELVKDINSLRKRRFFDDVELAVPEFQVVPVDTYRAWKKGLSIDDQLRPYFDWATTLKDNERRYSEKPYPADYIVRSSAVFSEDGEAVTGAGIYESVRVQRGATFEDFKDALTRVYKSTDNPRARAYRAQHGIDREEMGLIIQRFVSPHSYSEGQAQEGYINSRLPGVPQLMEIATETNRNFVNRGELDFFIALDADRNEDAFRTVHHFLPDLFKVDPILLIRVAQPTYIVERIWGKDIQAEFVAEGWTINFVQVRELPPSVASKSVEVQFPDEIPFHCGAAIGVGDMELPVLDVGDDNTQKTGMVVFRGNYGWTSNRNNILHLPQKGGVIIYNFNDGRNGHIQTLCAEKGLICLFPDRASDDRTTVPNYQTLKRLKRVRIVSNGIEGRVYKR